MRSFYSLSLSMLMTTLHIGCCIFPLLSIASLPVFDIGILVGHEQLFTFLQWAMLVWFSGRLAAFYFWNKRFHGRMEAVSYALGWVIAVSGLIINRLEPFKSDQQILAEQQFERFKTQRQLRISLTNTGDARKLVTDLHEIVGVSKGSIELDNGMITLSYHKEKVSPEQIHEFLKKKGYVK